MCVLETTAQFDRDKMHHLYFFFSIGVNKKFRTLGNSFNVTTLIPHTKSKTWVTFIHFPLITCCLSESMLSIGLGLFVSEYFIYKSIIFNDTCIFLIKTNVSGCILISIVNYCCKQRKCFIFFFF